MSCKSSLLLARQIGEGLLWVFGNIPACLLSRPVFFACPHHRHNEPLRWAAFAGWLTMLLNRSSHLAVKGLLRVAGVPTPMVIHGIQRTIHPPIHLGAWPRRRAARVLN